VELPVLPGVARGAATDPDPDETSGA